MDVASGRAVRDDQGPAPPSLARCRLRGRGAGSRCHQAQNPARSIEIPQETDEALRARRRDRHRSLSVIPRRSSGTRCHRQAADGEGVQKTGPRTHTFRSDDEKGPCNASGGCEVSRSSPPSAPPSTHFNRERSLTNRDWFAFVRLHSRKSRRRTECRISSCHWSLWAVFRF